MVTTKHNDFIMMASRYGREPILAEEREEADWVDKSASSAWSFDCMFWWGGWRIVCGKKNSRRAGTASWPAAPCAGGRGRGFV